MASCRKQTWRLSFLIKFNRLVSLSFSQVYANKMIPSKSKRSESRRSSILKPRKPRQPLQNVNFDSSSSENSPAASRVKRRVSFAEKKHVKEFCHSTEQGTVWDNTYEERDSSLKGSFVLDQNAEAESKENTSLYASNNDCTCSKGNSSEGYPNNYIVNCDLDFTNPVKSTESVSQLGYTALPSKSFVSKDAISNVIPYCDSNEECQPRQAVISSNITIYRDSDEDCADNIADTCYSGPGSNNINAELSSTRVQDLSMDLTTPIPAFLLSSRLLTEQEKEQKRDINNSDRYCTTNCNNISMEITEAVPIFAKSVASEQIPMILQNCENTKWNVTNTSNAIFPTNLQSDIVSKDISERPPNVKYANDTMVLTSVIQPFTDATGTNIYHTNNTALDTSKKMIVTSPKMYEKTACNEDMVKGNNLREDPTDKSEIFNDVSMEMTRPISAILPSSVYNKKNFRMDEPIFRDDRTMFFHNVSMEMTKAVATKNTQDITGTIPCKLLSEQNANDGKDVNTSACFNEGTRTLCKSMELTEIVPAPHERMLGTVQSVENTCEDHKNDRTDFNNASMEITKSVNILPLNIDKENLKIVKSISKDDKTTFFYNVSMEMTKTVSTKNTQDIIGTITRKSLSEQNANDGKDVNTSACFNEGTRTLCKSMELTEIVPAPHERMLGTVQSVENACEDHKNDRTDFNNASMEITKSVNILPLNIDKENLKIVESISKDDKTTCFHNVSMEMTTAVSSRNQKEVTQPITCEFKENIHRERDTNASIEFNEGTKSMEFTEVAPISLCNKGTFNTTNTTHLTQSTSFFQTLSKTISLPAENSAAVAYQIDVAPNKIIQDISMEITAGVPSTSHLIQDVKVNKTDNSIISKNDRFQNLTTNNNPTKSRKSITKENLTNSRDIMETERVCNSLVEAESSQENNVSSFPSTNASYVNDIERNECFIKDIIDDMQVSDSNLRDSLNEINKHSFLRKSLPCLENSFVELQSINPPSFLCDSEEENSSDKIQSHEPQSLTITDVPVNNTSNCSIKDNVTINSRENVTNVNFTILREKEVVTIENNQAEDCHRSIAVDKTKDNNQETNYQAITKAIINDNGHNKLNDCTKNIKNEESILSTNGKAITVQDINHCIPLIIKEINVTGEDQVKVNQDETEYTRKRINEDAKLQSNIKETGEYPDEKRRKTEKRNDYFEDIGAIIEDQMDSEEGRKNLTDETKQQNMGQKDECAAKELVMEQYVSKTENIENESLTEQDPFLTLSEKLETHGARDDCIWNVYYTNIDRKMIVFGFMANSLLIAIFLSYDFNDSRENLIKEIKIISRLADDAGILIKIVHKLILEKINVEILINMYKTHQDILPMLNFLTQEVKLAMDFMFDLRRLDDLNLMEIVKDEITFVSRSKRMDIILRVKIKVKRFDKLTPNDINLCYVLGKNKIKETDIKNLIKNVKKDQKFLRRYMNDVKDYIDIMEEAFK